MYEKYHSVFKASGIVENIDILSFDRALQRIKPAFKTHNARDCVVCDGAECKEVSLLLSGTIFIEKHKQNGIRQIIEIVHPGTLLGILSNPQEEPIYKYTCTAQTQCRLMIIPKTFLFNTDTIPDVSRIQLMYNIAVITMSYADRLLNSRFIFNGHSVKEKVASYLFYNSGSLQQNKIIIGCTRNDLADMMSIPRSSLSRELNVLAEEGVIMYDRYSITILDMERIRQLV